ncbi:hypothetical protein J3R83DRAFT_3121 [Lanmaoa asiatica]|nr:hypothetical protein J3R83DRAFT_3121 [Lanmaoa asiatica]
MSTAQCSAIVNAMNAKGYSYDKLAGQVGMPQQRVVDVLTGKAKPTQQEFGSIASALGLSNNTVHAAKVTV